MLVKKDGIHSALSNSERVNAIFLSIFVFIVQKLVYVVYRAKYLKNTVKYRSSFWYTCISRILKNYQKGCWRRNLSKSNMNTIFPCRFPKVQEISFTSLMVLSLFGFRSHFLSTLSASLLLDFSDRTEQRSSFIYILFLFEFCFFVIRFLDKSFIFLFWFLHDRNLFHWRNIKITYEINLL